MVFTLDQGPTETHNLANSHTPASWRFTWRTKQMIKRTILASTLMASSILVSGTVLACDAMGPSAHMGQLMSVNDAHSTFTIRDAQTQSPITFTANEEIMSGLKGASGSIMVKYEKEDDGSLNAVGVTF